MPTNNFPGVGYTNAGHNKNFFQKITVTATGFGSNSVDGYQPDAIITFPTQGVLILNEDAASVVQISFNGYSVAEELNPVIVKGVSYDFRTISKIWLKITSGSSAVVSIRAW
jgi:hypothetical protein